MERIGEEVERTLARSGSREVVPLAAVTAAWPDAVGDAVARNAWPRRLGRDGTLHVATASATWAHELDRMQEDVLDALRLRGIEPKGLRFAVGPVPEPPAPAASVASHPAPPEVPPEIASEASAAASRIEDAELRELVARAARASLLRARSGRSF